MKKSGYFWVGYSDLMTSLFFIMLVLFVISISYLNINLNQTKEELRKVEELQTAVKELDTTYFTYQPQFKRFKLNREIQFEVNKAVIQPEYHEYLINVGKSIDALIEKLKNEDQYKSYDIKYLVVIEGMSSKDSRSMATESGIRANFILSYRRALALYDFWKEQGIFFDQNTAELKVAGIGIDGEREHSGVDERLNQQLYIHIVPKIGKIASQIGQ